MLVIAMTVVTLAVNRKEGIVTGTETANVTVNIMVLALAPGETIFRLDYEMTMREIRKTRMLKRVGIVHVTMIVGPG